MQSTAKMALQIQYQSMHHIIHKVTAGYERLYDVLVYSVGRCLCIQTLEARTGLPSRNNEDSADTKNTACLILTGTLY